MKMFSNKKLIKPAIITVAAILVVLLLLAIWYGFFGLARFNSHSLTDWRLGGSVKGISSAEDAKTDAPEGFSWFENDEGMGIESTDGKTVYYMGSMPDSGLGGFRVTGFKTSGIEYTVLGIRVGSSELDAKTALFNSGYTVKGGGMESCTASSGRITVEFRFSSGVVSELEVHVEPTHIFGE